jgi:Ca-activated chloride channel family protein
LGLAHPEYLWLLLVFPALVLWAIRGRWLGWRGWRALAQRGRVPRDGTLALLAAVVCLIVALTQPRWGRFGPPPQPGHDVVLLVDVSRSMAAEDAVPNRLAVAKEAAQSLVNALDAGPANRAAVIAFAGRGVVRCPLTENLGAALASLKRLTPGAVAEGGTDLGAALDAALETLGREEHALGRTVVLFSDGEDHADRWNSRLERLREERIVVHVVAIGDSDNGHYIPTGKDAEPLLYRGNPVLSRRSDAALEAIARGTGGAFLPLGLTSIDLGALYQSKIEPAARRSHMAPRLADRIERFPLFLVAALGFLLTGCWPARRGWSPGWRWRRSVPALSICALAAALAGSSKGAGDARALRESAAKAAASTARGQAAYNARDWEQALAAFEAAASFARDSAIPRFNAAAALFQLGRYTDAKERYLEARLDAPPALRTKIDYALGNTALALGDLEAAIASYDDCLASTARGAALDIVRKDAAINRQFALEQRQSPALPQGESSGDRPQSERPERRRPGSRRRGPDDSGLDGEPDDGQGSRGTNPEAGSEGAENRQGPGNSRRRIGGAGGAGSAPPGSQGGSPDDRLDAALQQILASEGNRLPEEQPPTSRSDDRKDW